MKEPIFLLCGARTGSTLLRYILNAHPNICCPPELHLYKLANMLHHIYGCSPALPPGDGAVEAKVRADIDRIMGEFVVSDGKGRWCDKSVNSIARIELIQALYPGAKYICLYRNCTDQVLSALEVLEKNPGGERYGLDEFLRKAGKDTVGGLIDYWIWFSSRALKFEREQPDKCHRITYEALVANPEAEARALCEFLGEDYIQNFASTALMGEKTPGPGDHKIMKTNAVHQQSINKSGSLGKKSFTPKRLKQLEQINKALGYKSISPR